MPGVYSPRSNFVCSIRARPVPTELHSFEELEIQRGAATHCSIWGSGLERYQIHILNVAGNRESSGPGIQRVNAVVFVCRIGPNQGYLRCAFNNSNILADAGIQSTVMTSWNCRNTAPSNPLVV
jgi:hypothetical protein